MTSSDKVFLPIPPPTAILHKNDPRAVLSTNEQKMFDEVLAHFTRADPVYVLPDVENGELTEREKFWLSRECLLRYLRASKWKVSTSIERIEATLKWRREFGLYDKVTASHVEPEAVTGKEVLFGYDTTGKPALYMIPSRQNTTEAPRQIDFAVWMLERTIDLMEPGVENLALLINFADRGKNPSLSTALAVLNILQNHYPERLGLALIINVPFLVNAFFKIVMPLVDPITRQKVKFNPEIFKDGFFEENNVMKEWGGSVNFEYDHEKYWAELNKQCDERTEAWFESWKRLGARVGISEWAYKQDAKLASAAITLASSETEQAASQAVDRPASEHKGDDSAARGAAPSIAAAAGAAAATVESAPVADGNVPA
ncbi:hypothetical protein D9613_007525 [Agrocybe pediades]|uniref:CRAL-TRIO domain-containing protein n=1 Tax=Agrocybe pediades TaxID=84607 RepID=A0A8H4QMN1_9AGAR|nr:hypothetical protein D9613_007525 [Agrocybe pediades]